MWITLYSCFPYTLQKELSSGIWQFTSTSFLVCLFNGCPFKTHAQREQNKTLKNDFFEYTVPGLKVCKKTNFSRLQRLPQFSFYLGEAVVSLAFANSQRKMRILL